ncbi:hypothetical protein [Blastococcus sp. CCUG 61487]|uniref:hypothetical protein n=1 Tax=Blastococcus sp. CCUG 61487 TaxID=1840703 RepID=UPI001484EE64|nr:hypothetical protein [Blastococcus sp. CCUG 61487]
MTENRFAIPLEDLVAGAQVAREDQVEVQQDAVVPPPDEVLGGPFYGDGMSGDVDGD